MPAITWDLVATIVVGLTIFYVLRMIVVVIYAFTIEHLQRVKRIKATRQKQEHETKMKLKVVK